MQRKTVKNPLLRTRRGSATNGVLVLLVVVLAGIVVYQSFGRSTTSGDGVRPVTARGDLAEDEKANIKIYETAAPSVVHITSVSVGRDSFNLNPVAIPRGTGSGFVWDRHGHIVTNYHVVQQGDRFLVTLSDNAQFEAERVGVAPDKDLAVLKLVAPREFVSRLRPILVGRSADLRVGQKVFAIGNPFGLDQTLTTGVISGLGREIEAVTRRKIRDVVQTDAAINPGNSGGPLLDSAARLIGVNTMILSPSGAYAGIGFAVPVDEVARIVPQLVQHGRVIRPGIGIAVYRGKLNRQGVLVLEVIPGGPAAKAGIRPTRKNRSGGLVFGDLIVAIDDTTIQNADDLFAALEKKNIGDTVSVTVEREDDRVQIDVQITELSKLRGR